MLMNIIGKNCSNQLGNSGHQQIGVKCLGILSFTVGKTETVFEVINGLFNDTPDLIDSSPFECPTKGSGVGLEIFFQGRRKTSDHRKTAYRDFRRNTDVWLSRLAV